MSTPQSGLNLNGLPTWLSTGSSVVRSIMSCLNLNAINCGYFWGKLLFHELEAFLFVVVLC